MMDRGFAQRGRELSVMDVRGKRGFLAVPQGARIYRCGLIAIRRYQADKSIVTRVAATYVTGGV